MKLSKDLVVLVFILAVIASLSGCVEALIPNHQVAQTTARALGSSPSSITRIGDYQTIYRVDYLEAVEKGRIYSCSMSVPDVMGAAVDVTGSANCHPDKVLETATARALSISPSELVVQVQDLSNEKLRHHYKIAYTVRTADHGNYRCVAVGVANKARLIMKWPPKCTILMPAA